MLRECSFHEIAGWNYHPLVRGTAYLDILPLSLKQAIRKYDVIAKRRVGTDSKTMFLWVLRTRSDTRPEELYTDLLTERKFAVPSVNH